MTDASPFIDDALVRRLVSTQFPRWATLSVKAVEPAEGYPWKWSIYRWIEGDVATPERISNLGDCAGELARFLIALHEIDPTDGPRPGLGFDDGTWDRARGWTLWKAAITAVGLTETNASDREQSLRVIDEVLSDWRRSL